MEMKATAAKPVTPALLEAEDVNMAGPEPPQVGFCSYMHSDFSNSI
jgi:hypothetical protein